MWSCTIPFSLALPPSPSSLSLPSRWVVFTFGDPVPREIIAGRRILIVTTYDLLRYVRFIFVLTRPEWRFKRCCGSRPWTSGIYDLHFILMSTLNGYRLLRSACSQPPPSPLPLAEMIISREKSRWWGMLHATFVPMTGQLPFRASIVIKTLSSPRTQFL